MFMSSINIFSKFPNRLQSKKEKSKKKLKTKKEKQKYVSIFLINQNLSCFHMCNFQMGTVPKLVFSFKFILRQYYKKRKKKRKEGIIPRSQKLFRT